MLRLAIAPVIDFPVHFSLLDGSRHRQFHLRLSAQRLSGPEWDAAMLRITSGEPTPLSVEDFLRQHLTGWEGQTLVVDEQDKPSPFTPRALDMLLSLPDMPGVIFAAYRHGLFVQYESERQKN